MIFVNDTILSTTLARRGKSTRT